MLNTNDPPKYPPGPFAVSQCELCKGNTGHDDLFVVNSLGNKLCTLCIRWALVDKLIMTGSGPDAYERMIIKEHLTLILFATGLLPIKRNKEVFQDVLRICRQQLDAD